LVDLKVGDEYECPEGHKGEIVWVHEDLQMIGVRCHKNHVEYSQGKGKKKLKNMVFIITIT
jgi:hypothetical protein